MTEPQSEDEKLALEMQRGQQAYELLQNPLWNQIIMELEDEFIIAWRGSDPRDDDGRERAWHGMQQLGKMRAKIEQKIESARMASSYTRDQEERKARLEVIKLVQLEEQQFK
jgi:hypothetical protein